MKMTNVRVFSLGMACIAVAAAVAVFYFGVDPLALAAMPLGIVGAEAAAPTLESLAKQIGEATDQLKASREEMKTAADTALRENENLGKVTAETRQKADEMMTRFNKESADLAALTARFEELEQKAARRGNGDDGPQRQKSIGELFVESDQGKSLSSAFRGQAKVTLARKDILSVDASWGTGRSDATSITPALRVPGIIDIPLRQLTIRDLIAPGQTGTNSVEYARETVFTNAARVVSEGGVKPKSNITFELVTSPVRTIAHIFKASRQILDDAPALRSYIDARARQGLLLAEEDEILMGDGSGQHLHGLIPQATAYAAQFTPSAPTVIDTIRLAMLQVMLALFPPTGIVMHPIDWVRAQLTKDGEGRYIMGNPQETLSPRLWGLPVVQSMAVLQDEFLVGNFNMAAQIFDRMDLEILLSTENVDDFERNLVTIRCEERLALAVYRPAALVHGDFGNVT